MARSTALAALPEGMTDPAYVALITLAVSGLGFAAYGQWGRPSEMEVVRQPDGGAMILDHFKMMRNGGLLLAGVTGAAAIGYLLLQG